MKPKNDPFNGNVAWQAYEMKLEHMTNQCNWGEAEKLNRLVEALQDKALTFYSNLPDNVHENYGLVRRKFNAQFGPKDLSQTVCKQLNVVQQKPDEGLEEFAAHCHQVETNAWGDISIEAVDCAAVDTFLHGTIDSKAAWKLMQQSPQNIDDAFEYLQQAMHNWKSLLSSRNRTKAVWSVSFAEETKEKVIYISKLASNSPPSKLEERFSKLESSVEQKNKQMAQILHLLQNKSPSRPGNPLEVI